MPSTAALARSINTLCVVRAGAGRTDFPVDGVTFRGTGFDNRYRNFFDSEPNKKYRVPGFLATSFSEAKAKDFAFNNGTALGQPAVLWVVHVDPRGRDDADYRCKHVNFVQHTLVAGELEYLFTAYSVFTVRRCVGRGRRAVAHRGRCGARQPGRAGGPAASSLVLSTASTYCLLSEHEGSAS